MKIKSVAFDGFRGLPDREFSFGDGSGKAPPLIVVTGPTASGKTSFLDAIVAGKEGVAPYGAVGPASHYVRYQAAAAKVKIAWELDSIEREQFGSDAMLLRSEAIFGAALTGVETDPVLASLLIEYDPEPTSSKVEYFHATRRMPIGSAVDPTRLGSTAMERASRLTKDDTKYAGLVRFVVAAGLGLDVGPDGKQRPTGRVTAAFEKLCTSKKIAGLYRAGDGVFPGFLDLAGRPLGLSQLTDGELDAFLFAATFVRSGIRRSVVLVDTPELHRSDAEAKAFVNGLLAIEEDNQLIVATRSPSVVGMVPKDRLVTLG